MAMNLLTAVQSNPALPVEFRTVAVSVANNAIAFANQELARQPVNTGGVSTLPVVVPTTNEQATPINDIIIPMKATEMVIKSDYNSKKDPINNVPYGSYAFNVRIIDGEGKHLRNEIEMVAPDNVYPRGVNTIKTPSSKSTRFTDDWNTTFEYVPTSSGVKNITFTSGDITKEVIITVNE